MGLFDFILPANINKGLEEWKAGKDAVLLDVRSNAEYKDGHIPGSVNIPLNDISKASSRFSDKNTPLFVHCLSGARSSQAVQALKKQGFTNVKNIGGINGYNGTLERS